MFGPDVFMVEALRLLVGELHHLAGPVGEAFVHWPITLRHGWTVSCEGKAIPRRVGYGSDRDTGAASKMVSVSILCRREKQIKPRGWTRPSLKRERRTPHLRSRFRLGRFTTFSKFSLAIRASIQ